jgi:hypothetical protein
MENVVRCKYIEAGVHIKNPIKNSYQDGLGGTIQTLDHVVVVHILIWDKRKSQINEYSDRGWTLCFLQFDWWNPTASRPSANGILFCKLLIYKKLHCLNTY